MFHLQTKYVLFEDFTLSDQKDMLHLPDNMIYNSCFSGLSVCYLLLKFSFPCITNAFRDFMLNIHLFNNF